MSRRRRKKSQNRPIFTILGVLVLIVSLGLMWKIYPHDKLVFALVFLSTAAGLVLETSRLYGFRAAFNVSAWAMLGSYWAYLPGKREQIYDLQMHIEFQPFAFIAWFLFIVVVISRVAEDRKLTPPLHEGLSLMQSIAFVYLLVATEFYRTDNLFLQIVLGVAVLLLVFALLNAFLPIVLSKWIRFVLSLWSVLMMSVFALYNLWLTALEDQSLYCYSGDVSDLLILVLRFFLLGISALYIAMNIYLIFDFLPERGESGYFRRIAKLYTEYANRFVAEQLPFKFALPVFVCVLGLFAANYYFSILPVPTAIWLVMFVLPLLVSVIMFSVRR
ncbi:MAG: hypothetical protein LBR81_03515 [Prevotellaceae bacterium]|jgi:hypothetical protein|nr:hypothetical protein [Prevotellaceae bacterium]